MAYRGCPTLFRWLSAAQPFWQTFAKFSTLGPYMLEGVSSRGLEGIGGGAGEGWRGLRGGLQRVGEGLRRSEGVRGVGGDSRGLIHVSKLLAYFLCYDSHKYLHNYVGVFELFRALRFSPTCFGVFELFSALRFSPACFGITLPVFGWACPHGSILVVLYVAENC